METDGPVCGLDPARPRRRPIGRCRRPSPCLVPPPRCYWLPAGMVAHPLAAPSVSQPAWSRPTPPAGGLPRSHWSLPLSLLLIPPPAPHFCRHAVAGAAIGRPGCHSCWSRPPPPAGSGGGAVGRRIFGAAGVHSLAAAAAAQAHGYLSWRWLRAAQTLGSSLRT